MDTATAKALSDKLYEKRKAGALEYVEISLTTPPLSRIKGRNFHQTCLSRLIS